MNQYEIIGNLVRNPEPGVTPSGINYCKFVVAVRRKRPKDGENEAEFVRVTAWRGLGDSCAKYLAKGRKVCVTGEPRAHAWTGQDGAMRCEIEINSADEVEFLSSGSAPAREDPPAAAAETASADPVPEAAPHQVSYTEVQDEELPF